MIAAREERRRLIEANLPLARRVARRYAGRGERAEDLVQVGALALVRAVDRCDPNRPELNAYFAACVEGEILHYLRDRTSVVRLPRGTAASFVALDDDVAGPPAELDERLLDRAAIASAVRSLDERERRIVLLLFFCDRTQSETAAELGLSQAHVSRLLAHAIVKLRRRLQPPTLSRPARDATLRGDGLGREQADRHA